MEKTFKALVELEFTMEPFSDETEPLPSQEEVIVAWREYTGNQVLGRKELEGTGNIRVAVEATIQRVTLEPVSPD